MEELLSNEGNSNGLLTWAPTIDGVELTQRPEQLLQNGNISSRVPVILGTVLNEGTSMRCPILKLIAVTW